MDSMENKTLLLFSFERCGSSTLLHLMNDLLQEDFIHEPFNRYVGDYSEYIEKHDLEGALKVLKQETPGFKHIEGQISVKENRALLSDPDLFVIFLYRKNAYARALSYLLAKQTDIWHHNKEEVLNSSIEPINLEHITTNIASYEGAVQNYKNFLYDNTISHTELSYESLYDPKVTDVKKLIEIKKAFSHIKPLPENSIILEKIKEYLSPRGKYSTQKVYRRIPNMKEMDKAFGKTYSPILKNPILSFFQRFFR